MYKILMWDNDKIERSRNVVFDEGHYTKGLKKLTNLYDNPYISTESITDPFTTTDINDDDRVRESPQTDNVPMSVPIRSQRDLLCSLTD